VSSSVFDCVKFFLGLAAVDARLELPAGERTKAECAERANAQQLTLAVRSGSASP